MKFLYIHSNQQVDPEVSDNGVSWKTVSDKELEKVLKKHKGHKDTAIIYSRENPEENPSEKAFDVFSMVKSVNLPIKLIKNKGSNGTGETEPNGEPSYANCLLVTISKSPGFTVTIKPDQPIPNLKDLTTDPADLAWTLGLPFDYDKLNPNIVIKILLSIPGNNSTTLYGETHVFSAKMVMSGGKTAMVAYRLTTLVLDNSLRQLDLTRLGN